MELTEQYNLPESSLYVMRWVALDVTIHCAYVSFVKDN